MCITRQYHLPSSTGNIFLGGTFLIASRHIGGDRHAIVHRIRSTEEVDN